MREIDIVELIQREAHKVLVGMERVRGQRRIPNPDILVPGIPFNAGTNLSPVSQLVTEIQPVIEAANPVFRDAGLILQYIYIGSPGARMRYQKEARCVGDRQKHLG